MECVYRIPICGGFCAPTKSPEKDCFRHVSNEFTVAGGPILFKQRGTCETSRFCNFFGKCGFNWGDPVRKIVMMIAMTGNLVAIAFLIVAALGSTTDGKTLTKVYWATGHTFIQQYGIDLETFIGVKLRYDRMDCTASFDVTNCTNYFQENGFTLDDGKLTREMRWTDDAMCEPGGGDQGNFDDMQEACDSCKSIEYSAVSLWLSCLTQLPTAATNCQRSTRFGDVNCQATMGVFSNLATLYLGLVPIAAWHSACYVGMPQEIMGNAVTWEHGVGFVLLVAATSFKFIDAVLHFVVPTPVRVEKKTTKTIEDYMMLAYETKKPYSAAFFGSGGCEGEASDSSLEYFRDDDGL